tara:strand:- start:26 stop:310 length:285 start_codon:yes stop_codon:yes gene_type:complete
MPNNNPIFQNRFEKMTKNELIIYINEKIGFQQFLISKLTCLVELIRTTKPDIRDEDFNMYIAQTFQNNPKPTKAEKILALKGIFSKLLADELVE